MAKRQKTLDIIEAARAILADAHPMTVRQVYYQLVSIQLIENKRTQYQAVSDALAYARKEGIIPWGWMEDRLRRPREVPMWKDLSDFGETVIAAYRRDVWASQQNYIECWLEKDALSGIFEDLLSNYGVTLNVGRGYDGWDSIHNAADRMSAGDSVRVLYFGDFDPSGEDMVRSLRERLGFLGCKPQIIKCALTRDDIDRYKLPPNFTKTTDSRAAGFVALHGDISVELDALPAQVLRERIVTEIEKFIDLDELQQVKELESAERERLSDALKL